MRRGGASRLVPPPPARIMHAAVSLTLAPLGAAFAQVVRVRRWLHASGLLPGARLDATVVSVGNLSLGGTGKTPITATLARRAQAAGRRVAVLSRGYRRRSSGRVLVADHDGVRADVDAAGDEALLLARALPGVAVVVDRDRASAGRFAVRTLGADLLLLDDGFQHLAVERDLDIVLIDATTDPERARTLPAGRLREPLDALRHADVVLLTRAHHAHDEIGLRRTLRRYAPGCPIYPVRHTYTALVDVHGRSESVDELAGAGVLALSSIGNPVQFERDLECLGARITERLRFRDHHRYRASDLELVIERARRAGSERIVTTTKDLIRLEALPEPPLPLHALTIEPVIADLDELVRRVITTRPSSAESSL